MTLAGRIHIRLKKLEKTERGASLEAGLSDSFLRNIREGKSVAPRTDTLEKVARVLQTTSQWLISGEGGEENALPDLAAEKPNAIIGSQWPLIKKSLSVYGQAVGGIDGEFPMNGNALYNVFCPPQLSEVADAYAVLIAGDSMSPRYQDGEMAFVDPTRQVKKGDYVVAQIKIDENQPPYAYVKRFIRHNTCELVLEQLNPEKELFFPHERVVSVHFIVLAGTAQ